MLKKGDLAPDFCLKNQDEIEVSLKDLIDRDIVLYFYPKDNTSGCTLQAQDFSCLREEFEKKGAIVIGISPDSPKSHKNFIQDKQLDIMLLSDIDKTTMKIYGAYGKKIMYGKEVFGVIRSTFIIKEGKIVETFYGVRVKGHAQKVLEFLN